MDTVTKCYLEDQVKYYMNQFNPTQSVNFSEAMYRVMLQNSDRIQACNRYTWFNLPNGFDGLDIETMLYSYGSICCYSDNGNIIFAPFSMSGKLNKKGELNRIQPITLDGNTQGTKKRVYNKNMGFEFDDDCSIIIKDYTGAIQNNKIVSRETINLSTTINDEVKTYKILLYNIIFSIKKMIVQCDSEDQVKTLQKQASLLLDPTQPILALTGGKDALDKFDITQFVDKVEVDDLTRAIDFYNKVRRLNNGVPAPDTFEKKERMITDEVENAGLFSNLILQDGFKNRARAASYINECYGLDIAVEISSELGA